MRKLCYFFFIDISELLKCFLCVFFNDGAVCPVNLFMNKQPLEPSKIAQITECGAMNFQKRD